MPPNTHLSNAAEQAIRIFKAHFIAILAIVAQYFPRNLWDLLLPQTEVTLNLLWQATLDPSRSAWAYFHGPFNYDSTPLGLLGFNIIAHKKTGTRNLWDFRDTASWNLGVSLQHYQCHTILAKATKAAQVSDTVEFIHHHLTLPYITMMDRIVHGVTTLICAFKNAPAIACNNQLVAIQALHQAIQRWAQPTLPFVKVPQVANPPPTHTRQHLILHPMRRPTKVQPHALLPRVVIQKPNASPSSPTIA